MSNKNLASLLAINIDKTKTKESWDVIKKNNPDIRWETRTYIVEDTLDLYTKSIIQEIKEKTNLKYKNMLLQVSGKEIQNNEKQFLNIVHMDIDRKSCITIPLVYSLVEPIMFYNEIKKDKMGFLTNLNWPEKPVQVSQYSQNHPTLVNVSQLHSVRLHDYISPRVLLQLSFDESFEDILNRNPDIWQLM